MEQALTSPKQIGELVRQRREELNKSQKAVATDLAFSQATLHKIERGRSNESKHLARLFQYLGLPLESLPSWPQQAGQAWRDSTTVTPAPVPPDAHGKVAVAVTHEAVLIRQISYDVVAHPEATGQAILITWTANTGDRISGLLDQAMIRESARYFHRCAKQLGIDLT